MSSKLCGRPLTFGDPEQIAAIREEQQKIAEQEARTEIEVTGKLKKFRCKVYYRGYSYVTVMAVDKEHAEKIARADADDEPDYSEITSVDAREL